MREREREYAQISEREKLQSKFLLKFSYGKILSKQDLFRTGFKTSGQDGFPVTQNLGKMTRKVKALKKCRHRVTAHRL